MYSNGSGRCGPTWNILSAVRAMPFLGQGILVRHAMGKGFSDTNTELLCVAVPPRIRAFSLIELLVVVSILALLISVLLPSLKRAREQARRLQCSSNLKAIATASLTYAAADREEHVIPIHPLSGVVPGDLGAYDWGGKAGRGEPTAGDDPLSSVWSTQLGRGPGTRPLNAVLYKSGLQDYRDDPGPQQANWIEDQSLPLSNFRCPADRGFSGHHFLLWAHSKLSSFDHYGNSYYANVFGGGERNPGTPAYFTSLSPFYHGPTLINNPANTLYYWDNAGRFAWHLSNEQSDGACVHRFLTAERSRRVRGWHGVMSAFQAAFADGHAETIEMEGHRYPPPPLSRYPHVIGWVAADGSELSPEYYRCAIIRGDGWQIDVLPSPGILTPFLVDRFPCLVNPSVAD